MPGSFETVILKARRESGRPMLRRALVQAAAMTGILVASAAHGQAVPPSGLNTTVSKDGVNCHTEMVPMRDGTRLYTEVYLPEGSEGKDGAKRPVVIIRSPYGDTGLPEGCFRSPTGAPRIGSVVIVQSVRGTGTSEGYFSPILQERDDGADIIAWAAKQPWSNGQIAMTSGSYLGMVQWQAALAQPEGLVAITPLVMGASPYDDWTLRNGVFDVDLNHAWAQQFAGPAMRRSMAKSGTAQRQIDAAVTALDQRAKANGMWLNALPLAGDWDPETRAMVPFLWEQYSHPSFDDYWRKLDAFAQIDKITVPALVGSSWHDYFTKGSIDSYIAITARGGSESARTRSMLTIDCCGHSPGFKMPLLPGQIDWGPNRMNYLSLRDRFLERHFSGSDAGFDAEPRVQLAILVPPDTGTKGDTFVYKTTAWPVPGTRYVDYYLSSGGQANSLDGDGILSTSRKSQGPADTFLYDPMKPVPSIGGGATGALLDQTPVQRRDDVLVYTAPPAVQDTLLIGAVSLSFWAQTDGRDTDFTAKLVDVHPDGFAHIIADRIVRGRFRQGAKLPPQLLVPNRALPYELELGYTGMVLRTGHRLRLEISSSNFPKYQRNLNTGASNELTAVTRTARNMILHDSQHPSVLRVPTVPGPIPQPGSTE